MADACLRTAGCPSAERNVLTTPTGGALPNFAPEGVETPLAQPRQPGRADTLKRRRKERDEILGRDGKPLQSPSRKGRRQTLYRCLVQPAQEVDASFQNELLVAVSRASSSEQDDKTGIIQSPSKPSQNRWSECSRFMAKGMTIAFGIAIHLSLLADSYHQ